MLDLSLNSNFSVHLDDRHDLVLIDGREEFEQAVVVALTDYLHSTVIGAVDEDTVRQRLRLEASRVARDHDRLDEVVQIDLEPDTQQPNVYNARIVFQSDEVFNFRVSE